MRYTAELAFVLHARAWRETSLLVEVLSHAHGRIGLVARGVQGPKKHMLRAALQPLQHIRFDGVQRGELAHLNTAEAIDEAPRLQGDAMLAGFYLNEVMLRLAPRHDDQGGLYAIYGETRARLALTDLSLAWTLRRFERDLLDALGVGFALEFDGDGEAIDPAARYRLDADHGPRRVLGEAANVSREARGETATGRALLDLAADREPCAEDLPGLRRVMRAVLLHHLGGRGLKSWELIASLPRGVDAKSRDDRSAGDTSAIDADVPASNTSYPDEA
ncbi:MAG: DNA repair protein RecO [Xanthomonadaceae bacterium]|nr:DNA repair protein RecO [Xanthomonadaceae bacterium]